jgi:hypothetical protein
MRIVMLNPFLASVVRRRHTTLVTLREHGQEIELLFTSLRALDALRQQISEAIRQALDGAEGTEWVNPYLAARRRAHDEASDLLYDAGLLDKPEFMARAELAAPPRVERLGQRSDKSAGPDSPAGSPRR